MFICTNFQAICTRFYFEVSLSALVLTKNKKNLDDDIYFNIIPKSLLTSFTVINTCFNGQKMIN